MWERVRSTEHIGSTTGWLSQRVGLHKEDWFARSMELMATAPRGNSSTLVPGLGSTVILLIAPPWCSLPCPDFQMLGTTRVRLGTDSRPVIAEPRNQRQKVFLWWQLKALRAFPSAHMCQPKTLLTQHTYNAIERLDDPTKNC